MKQTATVVIGSAWGDEGKGLFTDFLVHSAPKNERIVIRFNGGAQAGHTVVTPDGRRHVFSHFGSGAFTGAPTFLTEDFILNPILFMKEKNRLLQLGIEDKDLIVYVDPRAVISTPYDMLINQIAERHRGNTRHGSVGIGIGETVERSIFPQLRIVHGEMNIKTTNDTFQKLKRIRTEWVQQRLQILGIDGPNEKTQALFNQIQNDEIIERWMEDYHDYHASTIGMEVALVLKTRSKINGSVIFEGAQGLLLDQNHAYFPYVTRSNTGLTNVVKIAQEIGIEHLDVYYLHRAYATRHGAGPFPHESDEKPYQNIFDNTNKKAEFQGSLRFGLPDLDLIASTISDDFLKNSSISLTPHLGITCFDQIDERVSYYHNNEKNMASHEGFIHTLEKLFTDKSHKNLGDTFVSYGPTRNDIKTSADIYQKALHD